MARHRKKATKKNADDKSRLEIRQEGMPQDRAGQGLHTIKPGSQNRKK